MDNAPTERVTLDTLRHLKARGQKFAMLTAYDYPMAVAAQAAGVHGLLIGDSMGTVLLGHANTRQTPLSLMLTLGEAVRRGAPHVHLWGDLPYEALSAGPEAVLDAARRFRDEAGCDAVKLETGPEDDRLVANLARAGIVTVAHLGLRPQQVVTADGYRPQARDSATIAQLVETAGRMVAAGAAILLLEAGTGRSVSGGRRGRRGAGGRLRRRAGLRRAHPGDAGPARLRQRTPAALRPCAGPAGRDHRARPAAVR